MPHSYVYFENDVAIIGNDYIERRFSTKNDKLSTLEIINKRIPNTETLKFNSFSAEFFIGFKIKKLFGYSTEFLSSNSLTLDNVNVFKRRVEFIFKPYAFNGARITFIMSVEIDDNNHYMTKYIEMMIDPDKQHLVTVDYIDCEHISFDSPKMQWTIGNIDKAYLSEYHSALGQPFYINGLFFGSEFPLAENTIKDNTAYIRYFSGKRFDRMNLNFGHTYKTWNTVVGAGESLDFNGVRKSFLEYIRKISRNIKPRFQYNSWYDHMHNITNENIMKSFMEIEKNLSKTLVPPLDSYVVDDGFVDWDASFWEFNSKFPNELYPASTLARKFSSEFGLWNGPRGGYNEKTPSFARNMEKAGKGGFNHSSHDVCVSSLKYVKNITEYYLDSMKKFDINYWKLDGFLLKACPSKNHGHMTGGYKDMYQYTEMWENWIDVFRKIRLSRESAGKSMWINQTSYCNASPWFLQWADSLWMQNSSDIGFIEKAKKGEALSTKDHHRVLTYRDDRYYDFAVRRNYQFPYEAIYNHDPIYGNTAKINMTDDEYREYMLLMACRGNAFWELYYSYNMFNDAKWRINADALRFIRNEYETLKTARFIGGCPADAQVYGFSSWSENTGIVSLRNPAPYSQTYTLILNDSIGVSKTHQNMKMANIYPYTEKCGEKLHSYGDVLTITLEPLHSVIMKFSNKDESTPSLIYGRFDSEKELLLFFDDRVYLDDNSFSSDREIEAVELLDDYSTLKITFRESVTKAFVSVTVKNAFGNPKDATFSGTYYNDLVSEINTLQSGRDFTIMCTISEETNTLLNCGEMLSVTIHEGVGVLRFDEKISCGDKTVAAGDKIAVVCEPNGLAKLYVNGELSCSSYNKNYVNELENSEVVFAENTDNQKIISKALAYDEIMGD